MKQRRTAAGVAGQTEFTFDYEPEIVTELGIEWLVQWLEESIRAGSRFTAGQTIGLGWLNCYVIERADGTLGLCEPDFVNVPPILAEGPTLAVTHLWNQREVADSFGLGAELDVPHYVQYAVTCEAFHDADTVVMHRYEHDEDESGWFIGCLGEAHDHDDDTLRSATLYELAVANRAIVGYLGLPQGCTVFVSDGPPEVLRDGEPLEPEPGSLIATMFGGGIEVLEAIQVDEWDSEGFDNRP
ncbi:hypothetical protein FMUAM8_24660 [Nocardia cyriacigeorgica]|nr:hypothetical protein FMUAM8_24660 [Nocardia cyriacigeorgica]